MTTETDFDSRVRTIAVDAFEIWNRTESNFDAEGKPASLQTACKAAADCFRPDVDDDRWLHATLALLLGIPVGSPVEHRGGRGDIGVIADPPKEAFRGHRDAYDLWVKYDNGTAEWAPTYMLQLIPDEPVSPTPPTCRETP